MTIVLVGNLILASLSLAHATFVGLTSPRRTVRKAAGCTATLAATYVLIFGTRVVFNHSERYEGWIGELGSAAAWLSFAAIWIWQLHLMDRHVKGEEAQKQEAIVVIERVKVNQ